MTTLRERCQAALDRCRGGARRVVVDANDDLPDFAAALLRVTGPEMRAAVEEIAYYDGQAELLMQAIERIAEGKGETP